MLQFLHFIILFSVELSELLNSLVDIAKTKRLSEDNVNALINSMFTSAGFENKESLNYEDFKTMMKEFKGDFLAIGKDFFWFIIPPIDGDCLSQLIVYIYIALLKIYFT